MKKPMLYLLMEIFICLLCVFATLLPSLWPQDYLLIIASACTYVLYPLVSLLLPLWSSRKGANPFLCALPPFLIYLAFWTVLGLNLPAIPTLLSLVLSVLGANIGAEIHKRAK